MPVITLRQSVASASFTRPADVVAYASGDLAANSTVAGSVVPMSLVAGQLDPGTFSINRLRLLKSGVGITNAAFRVHLFSAAPTVANGDNGAISMSGSASYLGATDITMGQAFTDGAYGESTTTRELRVTLASGTTIFALLEVRGVYTPTSGETFTLTADVLQN